MRNGDVTLRLLIVFSVAGFLALAAGLYEIDRREKSSSATGDHNFTEVDLRIQVLNNQIHILSAQLDVNQRQIQALSNQVQALTDHYDSRVTAIERQFQLFISRYDVRLKELEDDVGRRRLESAPVPR
jgi:predicted  nucleic acid-binding Zn-ribbon protein